MKRVRRKKVVGLAIGERSLLAAEVVAGEQPEVTRIAELVYPEGMTPSSAPAELGKALGEFLRANDFTARGAVVGLPAKWLVVRPKEIPAADETTVCDMLRLAAEADFSSELKELVYDFAGDAGGAESRSVLLMATPGKNVEAAVAMCEAARLTPLSVTPSAVALGEATGRTVSKDPVVLSVNSGGAEMTSQTGSSPGALRHLRSPTAQGPFVSELRRALLTLSPVTAGKELIIWDGAGLDSGELGKQLGIAVRNGDLPALGVTTSGTSTNGEGRKYAAAVALGLSGLGLGETSADFLHSRLAPPKQQRIPHWALAAVLAVIAIAALSFYAYSDLQQRQTRLARMQSDLDASKGHFTTATAFVTNVSFAQAWHGGDPRYLTVLRDLTNAMPEDGQTYATSITVHEAPHPQSSGSGSAAANAAKQADARNLLSQLFGKTSDQQHVQILLDRMKRVPNFTDVKLGGTQDLGKSREVSFSITFTYVPPPKSQ